MSMNILVYDNQVGYYQLLRDTMAREMNVSRFSGSKSCRDYQVLVFFMTDEMELLDFMKLYKQNIPVIFASSGDVSKSLDTLNKEGNIYYLNLSQHKENIEKHIKQLFSSLLETRQ